MCKFLLSSIAVLLLASCSNPPSTEEMAAKYTATPDAFEELRYMIIEDTGKKECFVVGLDNIGEYWEYDGKWTHSYNNSGKLPLNRVLDDVGLSEDRYEEYKRLFATTGSERVRFCHALKLSPQEVTVLVYRAGLAVSGCNGSINWRNEAPPEPTGKPGEGGDFTKITPLRNGWYLKYECS